MEKINKGYLRLIYQFGNKLKNPLFTILSLWVPLILIILSIKLHIINLDTMNSILIILGIPILYSVILIFMDKKEKRKKYKELKQLGIKVFGKEYMYKQWMNSDCSILEGKKPIEVDSDEARKILIKLDNNITN